jgi:hypothetical protein
MSGDKYLISDKSGCYFVKFTVISYLGERLSFVLAQRKLVPLIKRDF